MLQQRSADPTIATRTYLGTVYPEALFYADPIETQRCWRKLRIPAPLSVRSVGVYSKGQGLPTIVFCSVFRPERQVHRARSEHGNERLNGADLRNVFWMWAVWMHDDKPPSCGAAIVVAPIT